MYAVQIFNYNIVVSYVIVSKSVLHAWMLELKDLAKESCYFQCLALTNVLCIQLQLWLKCIVYTTTKEDG